ncbi:c-Myc-binding protein [Onthophagus taurus]|uniref:c-Myc-binding protein n=1 Tax=Onthophagus taurus TaxID=166361 RepID=UPI0039BE048E
MAANQTYKPSESKREEFRRYLEKTGVMDALTKALVSLYEEPDKPADALMYLLNKLALQTGGETLDSIKKRLQESTDKLDALQKENDALKSGNGAPDPDAPPPPDAPADVPPDAPADAPPPDAPADDAPPA